MHKAILHKVMSAEKVQWIGNEFPLTLILMEICLDGDMDHLAWIMDRWPSLMQEKRGLKGMIDMLNQSRIQFNPTHHGDFMDYLMGLEMLGMIVSFIEKPFHQALDWSVHREAWTTSKALLDPAFLLKRAELEGFASLDEISTHSAYQATSSALSHEKYDFLRWLVMDSRLPFDASLMNIRGINAGVNEILEEKERREQALNEWTLLQETLIPPPEVESKGSKRLRL